MLCNETSSGDPFFTYSIDEFHIINILAPRLLRLGVDGDNPGASLPKRADACLNITLVVVAIANDHLSAIIAQDSLVLCQKSFNISVHGSGQKPPGA